MSLTSARPARTTRAEPRPGDARDRLRRGLVMKAIESDVAQPVAAPLRLINFSTGVGRRVSKSSNFAHRGSMVIRTIC
jgi:hypothetical protein